MQKLIITFTAQDSVYAEISAVCEFRGKFCWSEDLIRENLLVCNNQSG